MGCGSTLDFVRLYMTTLRAATISDLETVASWVTNSEECRLWAGPRVPYPIELESLAELIGLTPSNSFSLLDERILVAFGQLLIKDESRFHLARLIVAPSLRGRGYGKDLVQALLQKARAASFARVSLSVAAWNTSAIALYSSFGFREAPRPSEEPKSPDSMYMERVT